MLIVAVLASRVEVLTSTKEGNMGYIDEKLGEWERVVYRTKLHSAVFLVPIILLLIAIVFFGRSAPGQSLAVLVFVWLILNIVAFRASELGVTNKRLLITTRYFRTRALDTVLDRIEGIQASQDFLGRKLGYGTVVVRGKDGSRSSFSKIANPQQFATSVQEQIEHNRKSRAAQ